MLVMKGHLTWFILLFCTIVSLVLAGPIQLTEEGERDGTLVARRPAKPNVAPKSLPPPPPPPPAKPPPAPAKPSEAPKPPSPSPSAKAPEAPKSPATQAKPSEAPKPTSSAKKSISPSSNRPPKSTPTGSNKSRSSNLANSPGSTKTRSASKASSTQSSGSRTSSRAGKATNTPNVSSVKASTSKASISPQRATDPPRTSSAKASSSKLSKNASKTSSAKTLSPSPTAAKTTRKAASSSESRISTKSSSSAPTATRKSSSATTSPSSSKTASPTPSATSKPGVVACKLNRRHSRHWKRITEANCQPYKPENIAPLKDQSGQPDVAAADPHRTGYSKVLKYSDIENPHNPMFIPDAHGNPVLNEQLNEEIGRGYATAQKQWYKEKGGINPGVMGAAVERDGFLPGVHRIDIGTSRVANPGAPPMTAPDLPQSVLGIHPPGHPRAGQPAARRGGKATGGTHFEEAVGWQKALEGKQRPHGNTYYSPWETIGSSDEPEKRKACQNCGPMLERGGGVDVHKDAPDTAFQISNAEAKRKRKADKQGSRKDNLPDSQGGSQGDSQSWQEYDGPSRSFSTSQG